MATVIRIVPGFIAAIVAFIALKLLIFFGSTALGLQILVFFLVYIIAAVAAEKAMSAYGKANR